MRITHTTKLMAGLFLTVSLGTGRAENVTAQEAARGVLNRLLPDKADRFVIEAIPPEGELDDAHNFNGATRFIAGVCSENRRVVGMMPHPERACDLELDGKSGGLAILRSAASPAAQV